MSARQPHVVALAGEVDHHSSPALRRQLFEVMRDDGRDIVVDLSEVNFIDSTTLGVLLDVRRRLITANRVLSLVCSDRNILRLLELTAFDRLFRVHPSLDDALRGPDWGDPAGKAVISGEGR